MKYMVDLEVMPPDKPTVIYSVFVSMLNSNTAKAKKLARLETRFKYKLSLKYIRVLSIYRLETQQVKYLIIE